MMAASPASEAPATGDVTDTVGAVVSLDAVTLMMADVAVLFAASRARADSVCGPFAAVALFHT